MNQQYDENYYYQNQQQQQNDFYGGACNPISGMTYSNPNNIMGNIDTQNLLGSMHQDPTGFANMINNLALSPDIQQ